MYKTEEDETLSLGLVMAMMIASIVIYFLLAIYFEAIFPSEFGVRRPVYFPFTVKQLFDATPHLSDNN